MISIIIPVYNRLNLLIKCIESIYNQNYKNFEIIVIDDNSKENIFRVLKQRFPFIKVLRNKTNMGPSYCKNLGTLKSKGKYILYLDSDVELINKNTLKNFLKLYKKNTGQIGGEGLFKDNKIVGVLGNTFSMKGNQPYLKVGNNKPIAECDFVNTCNCFIEKEKVKEVGGFDPYYVYYFEDMDFGFNVNKKYKNYFSLDVGVNHKFSKKERRNPAYAFYRNSIRFGLKNYGLEGALFFIKHNLIILLKKTLDYFKMKDIIKKVFIRETITKNYDEIIILKNTQKEKLSFLYILREYGLLCFSIFWNILYLKQTLNCRKKNFIDLEQLSNYKKPLFT
jgi:GT2 family glycosyltransferase